MFPFSTQVSVRWIDLDALNHVNNSTFLTYFEEGRIALFASLGWDWRKDGLIIARNEINYRYPLLLPDAPATVHLRVSHISGKSFEIEYLMQNKHGKTVADGKTILVSYDFKEGKSIPISEEARKKLEQVCVKAGE